MDKTNKFLMILIAIVIVGGLAYLFVNSRTDNINNASNNVDNSLTNPTDNEVREALESQNRPEDEIEVIFQEEYSEEDKLAFQNYLTENIDNITEQEPVLGGTFMISSFTWISNSRAFIVYEDGHNMHEAEVGLTYDDANNVKIDYFYDKSAEDEANSKAKIEHEQEMIDEEGEIEILENEPIE